SSIHVILAVLGSLGNIITIRTFFRMGMLETVNLTLAWLAASDLCFLVADITSAVALIFIAVEVITNYRLWFLVDPRAVNSVVNNIGSASYANTMLITTFVTVARCLIVAKPLRFRSFLSSKTTAVIMSIFSSISFTSMIILLSYLRVIPQYDSSIDRVRPTLWFSSKRKMAKDIVFGLRDAFLPFVSQIGVSVSVFIMARCLQEASKFRCIHTATHREVKEARVIAAKNTRKLSTCNSLAATGNSRAAKLLGTELKIVRKMLIIASVFGVCNMPKVIANLLEIFLPGFYAGQRYHAWYTISQIIREFFQTVNATVNFWIHWSFSSKFRKHCVSTSTK
ncbi:unnamed protein product, partial [Lymnaea stagnalis]